MTNDETRLRAELARHPDNRDAQIGLGSLLLRRCDFKAGWHYLYPRASTPKYLPAPNEQAPWLWNGECLKGKTILIFPDEGFGDMIQYFPLLGVLSAMNAALVLCQVPRTLCRLFEHNAPFNVKFLTWEDQHDHKEGYGADYYCAISQLPGLLSIESRNLPLAVNYLNPQQDDVLAWKNHFQPTNLTPRVGVVWQGNLKHARDHLRSMPLDIVKRMLLPSVEAYSLQMGTQSISPDTLLPMSDCTRHIRDFADTAACLHWLDAIVTVDTSAAHLACAMGKPAIILIDAEGDWRWGVGNTSLWYPHAKIIRQKSLGDWCSIQAEVQATLHQLKITGKLQ